MTAVAVGSQAGLGFDPYGTQVPLTFSGSCTAQATASVNSSGAIGTVTVTQGRGGLLGNHDGQRECCGNMGYRGAGEPDFRAEHDVLWRKSAEGQWRVHGLERGGLDRAMERSWTGAAADCRAGEVMRRWWPTARWEAHTAVDQFPGADFGAKLQACLSALSASNGGTCDARNFTGTLSMGSNLTISTANATVLLPCATISTANQIIVTAGTRNVSLRGCALRGASTASGSQGGTVFLYSGTGAMVQVGDPTYAADTMGFHLDNVVINTTTATSGDSAGTDGLSHAGDGPGKPVFSGKREPDRHDAGWNRQLHGGNVSRQRIQWIPNGGERDWAPDNESGNDGLAECQHVCAACTSIARRAGEARSAGRMGSTCSRATATRSPAEMSRAARRHCTWGRTRRTTRLSGLRNENSTNQVVADAGSSYNSWMTGGTMFTGQLTDNGTRNSFLDTFHRSFNGLNGDWYGSQKDATVTNHYRLGIGAGNERGLLDRYQTDYGYRWTMGLSDATAGEQFYQILDELNNVYRFSIGQYNNGQSSTNNQTVINAAGTGAVVLNGSNNCGDRRSGDSVRAERARPRLRRSATPGTRSSTERCRWAESSTFAGTTTVKNQADAEIDAILWAGLTASQKESFIYKDWNGNSQWYMVKDASNNWALNSATGGLGQLQGIPEHKQRRHVYQCIELIGSCARQLRDRSGNRIQHLRRQQQRFICQFHGNDMRSSFRDLRRGSGHNCLQIDNSGYITNTGSTCGSGGTSGTINTGTISAFAYYPGSGTALSPLPPLRPGPASSPPRASMRPAHCSRPMGAGG